MGPRRATLILDPHYGHGFEDIELSETEMIYTPNILVPRDSTYPFRSSPHVISLVPPGGLFELYVLTRI